MAGCASAVVAVDLSYVNVSGAGQTFDALAGDWNVLSGGAVAALGPSAIPDAALAITGMAENHTIPWGLCADAMIGVAGADASRSPPRPPPIGLLRSSLSVFSFQSPTYMAKISINNKEYDFEQLSKEAQAQVTSLQFVDAELQRLQAQEAVLRTARNAYSRSLQNELQRLDVQAAVKQ